MGIFVFTFRSNAYQTEHFFHTLFNFTTADVLIVLLDCFSNLFSDCFKGVKSSHRILENHGDLMSADSSHLRFAGSKKILTVKDNLTLWNATAD